MQVCWFQQLPIYIALEASKSSWLHAVLNTFTVAECQSKADTLAGRQADLSTGLQLLGV